MAWWLPAISSPPESGSGAWPGGFQQSRPHPSLALARGPAASSNLVPTRVRLWRVAWRLPAISSPPESGSRQSISGRQPVKSRRMNWMRFKKVLMKLQGADKHHGEIDHVPFVQKRIHNPRAAGGSRRPGPRQNRLWRQPDRRCYR